MVQSILRLLHIACSHRHTSKPFSKSQSPSLVRPRSGDWDAVTGTEHYVVCFDCGKELTYDWQEMRIAAER